MEKILLVSFNQFGYFTIYHNYCQQLKKEFKITYISFDEGLTKVEDENIHCMYFPLIKNKWKRQVLFFIFLIKEIKKNNYDAIVLKYFRFCSLIKLFCPFQCLFVDIRTGNLSNNNWLRNLFNATLTLESLPFNKVLILSDSLRKRLKIREKRAIIIPLGAYSLEHELKFDSLRLIYIGTLTQRKIEDTMVGLCNFLKKTNYSIEIHYDIVGFGTQQEESEIKNLIKQKKLSDYVIFHGRLMGEELKPLLVKANLGVTYVPITKGYDVQPVTKLFEYMLSGIPVIATATYENNRIVHEKNGVLISDNAESFCEGLEKIWARRKSYNSEIVRNSVEEYTWENIINNKLKPLLINTTKLVC